MSALYRFAPRVRTLLCATRLQLKTYASYPSHTIIKMPALSPTMTEGNLAVWSKQVGDKLEPGEVIAEIETDKAQMEFEFQEEGYLAKILVPAGTKDVQVNRPIGVYVDEVEDVGAFADFTLEASVPATDVTSKEEVSAKDSKPAAVSAKDLKPAAVSVDNEGASKSVRASVSRIIASPLAKTIALDKGISLKEVTGSGPGGRITKADVEAYLAKKPSSAAPVASAAATSYEDVPITTMRKVIGSRLLQSTQGTPSYIVSSTISVSKLLKLRTHLNTTHKDEFKISVNDFLIKSIAAAAKKVPDVNAYWLEGEGLIRVFKNVDVSVAVATPTGLYTPIVKNAESKGLTTISAEVKDLSKLAKENKLSPHEFQGGTICISNLGMNKAVNMFTSIINPPQSTILAIGTVERVAVEDVTTESGVSFDDKINITGTFDHRTVDGAKAGEFMNELKSIIEDPLELLL